LKGTLVGLRLNSCGTVETPRLIAKLYLKKSGLPNDSLETIRKSLVHSLGADDDLREFYAMASKDSILKYASSDLYGMHSTSTGDTVFPDAVLAILLQMAPLKRSDEMMDCVIRRYGQVAEFDDKTVPVWPLPQKLCRQDPEILAKTCKIGYRAKRIVNLSKKLVEEGFPSLEELEKMSPEDAKDRLMELPGVGDYSADIINPHGGFPIDVWSVEVFSKLFFSKEPDNNRDAIEKVKKEGVSRWGKWSWMAFFYVVQDLQNLSEQLKMQLRLS